MNVRKFLRIDIKISVKSVLRGQKIDVTEAHFLLNSLMNELPTVGYTPAFTQTKLCRWGFQIGYRSFSECGVYECGDISLILWILTGIFKQSEI